tara:strand:+ start:190 stop:387 length:198 start_codon:yes stop_codon:yes gene_type:complete
MAVPNNTTFNLQDVVKEVKQRNYINAGDNLIDCFLNMSSGGFDSTFSGNKDRLSNFRNSTQSPIR